MKSSEEQRKPVVLLGICGGIAAYKAVEVVSQLARQEVEIHVAMSEAAQKFVTPLTFQALIGRPVVTRMFADPEADRAEEIYPHLFPASKADVFVLLPATADMIGKIAQGFADDLIAAATLATPAHCLRFFCPAMNTQMWQQPIVQENVQLLERAGWHRIGPDAGALACGAEGEGRMAEPDDIVAGVMAALDKRNSLDGRRILILSGPTQEHIDPVRFISNPSSGKMGKALAEEAILRGALVDFVTGPVPESSRPLGPQPMIYPIKSAKEMLEAAKRLADQADILLFAAAVADYAPAVVAEMKQPKQQEATTLRLEPTPDIAGLLCQTKRADQVAIGFALQDEAGEDRARGKLQEKGLDGIVLNTLEAIGSDAATYAYLPANPIDSPFRHWGDLSKKSCARYILDEATRMLG